MNQQKNQDTSLLNGIQKEVAAENAPLLNLIIKSAPFLAGLALLALLIIAGIAIWNWYHGGKQLETHKELARINAQLQGSQRNEALSKLAENAPDSTKLFIYLSLGKSAQENNDPVLAAQAFAKAAQIDGDGALGLTAALNSAGSLLMQAEFNQALALLQELAAKLPNADKSAQFQQMLAEAASGANQLELASQIYEKLAQETNTPEKTYFQNRADELKQQIKAKN